MNKKADPELLRQYHSSSGGGTAGFPKWLSLLAAADHPNLCRVRGVYQP